MATLDSLPSDCNQCHLYMFNAVPPLTVFAEIVVSKGMIAALSMLAHA